MQTTDPTTDTYATIDPIEGIDGWRSVTNSTVRNAIPVLRRRQGMIVVLQTDQSAWQLKASPWAFDNTDWTAFGTGGSNTNGTVTSVGVNTANGFAGTVSNNATNARISITTSVNGILLGDGTNAAALTLPTHTVLGNTTSGTAAPAGVSLSSAMDAEFTAGQGDILYRGSLAWATRGAGNSGQFLQTQGAGANPVWASLPSAGASVGGVVTVPISAAFGGTGLTSLTAHGVLIGNGTGTVNVAAPSASGQILTDQGNAADPSFASTGIKLAQHYGVITATNSNGTQTLNLAASDWFSLASLTGNTTLAVANATNGQQFTIEAQQSNGNYSLTFFSGITWFGSPYSAPTMPVTNGAWLAATIKTTGTNTYHGWTLGTSNA